MKHSQNLYAELPKIKPEEIQDIILLLEQNNIIKYRHKDKVSTAAETYNKSNICARYIGKTRSEGKSMYDADFLAAIILNAIYYYQQTGKKAIIVQATGVYDVVKTCVDPYALGVHEQHALIEKIIQTHFDKKCVDMLQIKTVETMHPRLFKILKEQGIQGIKKTQRVYLDEESIDALTIAQYLYRCMESNDDFKQKMFRLKQGLEQNDILNDYYGMIEVACRLTDLLAGINTQCGEVRQNLYDDRLKFIITGDLKKYPELQSLQCYLKTRLIGNTRDTKKPNFNTVYIDGRENEKYNQDSITRKNARKQNLIKKRTKILLLTLGLGSATVAGIQTYDQHQRTSFLEQKQQKIQEKIMLTYNKSQIDYFNEHIDETKSILKTFYGIKDDGYIHQLIRPYMMVHPELIEYIIQQKGSYGDISPIANPISEYIAMTIMSDQEKHNFLEYVGDDALGYKKFDPYIPDMLHTLQYYDSIYEVNGSYELKGEQELVIPHSVISAMAGDGTWRYKHEIGSGLIRGNEKIRVFHVSTNFNIPGSQKYNKLIATSYIDQGMSDDVKTKVFIQKYLSYHHQTKYLARQASEYINQKLKNNNTELDYSEDVNRIGILEHIIQEFVLHGGDTKQYLTRDNIGEKVFNELIGTNSKCMQYFKEHILIDLETMTKLSGYESRRGKYAMSRGESNAYRNDPAYQKANKNFYKRD